MTAGADLGCRILVVANEKFISVSVRGYRNSDAPGQHVGKYGYILDWRIVVQQRLSASLILCCLPYPFKPFLSVFDAVVRKYGLSFYWVTLYIRFSDVIRVSVANFVHVVWSCGVACRPDRDKYIDIERQNVLRGRLENFAKKTPHEINSLGQPYDLQSIMHYKQVCILRTSNIYTSLSHNR